MALGKGIASLLQDTPNKILRDSLSDTDVVSSKDMIGENDTQINQGVSLLQLDELVANAQQPRKIFKQEELHELAESIKENGIIQPIIVGPVEGGRYEIIAGERRYRAAKLANLDKVPVVVKRITKKEKMVFSIIENVQRDDLNCVEEALAYLQLISEFKKMTGVPVILNTSFNLNNEPIVMSPQDAIRSFYTCGLDTLVIGSFIIRKK